MAAVCQQHLWEGAGGSGQGGGGRQQSLTPAAAAAHYSQPENTTEVGRQQGHQFHSLCISMKIVLTQLHTPAGQDQHAAAASRHCSPTPPATADAFYDMICSIIRLIRHD